MSDLVIETDRLLLRKFRESDFPDYERLCANPDVMRYLGNMGKAMDTIEAWRSFAYHVGHWELRGYGYLIAIDKESGKFAGRIGFTNPEGWPGFELGWTIAPEFQRRGLATEGAKRLLKYAFEEMNQSHVISLIHPDNIPSIRVAEHLGEKPEGRTVVMGMPCVIYGIDRGTQSAA